jgi:1-acyl-sn-glycerol-3-phosphate acyltransferase
VADPDPTVEFSTVEPEQLRDHLPGLEPDRLLSDWGRSERVERLVDRTLYDFLYHYWFRAEVEGIENVPAKGGALLVANHAGAHGSMVAKAIREHHRRPRPVHLITDRRLLALPGLGMLVTKLGGVSDHPANLHRLLFDEGQLVLTFPEGWSAKPLRRLYRLRRFSEESSVLAAHHARAPIVPVAVVGAEEATPTAVRATIPLPAKFRIRFLDPLSPDQAVDADGLRALIQQTVLEMVAQRRSVWLG